MPLDGTTWKVAEPVPVTPSDPLNGRPLTSAKSILSCVVQTCPAGAVTVTVWAGGFGCPTTFMKVRLSGVTPRAPGDFRANPAVIVVAPATVTVHVPPPLHPPPIQPVKVEPAAAAAVSVTPVPLV